MGPVSNPTLQNSLGLSFAMFLVSCIRLSHFCLLDSILPFWWAVIILGNTSFFSIAMVTQLKREAFHQYVSAFLFLIPHIHIRYIAHEATSNVHGRLTWRPVYPTHGNGWEKCLCITHQKWNLKYLPDW